MNKIFDVLAVGAAAIDLVLKVNRLPGHDQKVIGEFVGWLPGGTVANCACAASRLGLRAAFLDYVGDDEAGEKVIADFQRFGVDTGYLKVRPGAMTNFTVILVDPTGERAIVVVSPLHEGYDEADLRTALAEARALYTMPRDQDDLALLAGLAHAAGAQVMIDVEPTVVADFETLTALLAHTDVASFNREGLAAALGDMDPQHAAIALLACGPHTVVVTLGCDGALAVTRDAVARHPGFRVEAVDTTGAGDTFNAAFLLGTLRGWPLAERLAFANAAAALSVTALGPRGHLPTADEVRAFLGR